MKTACLVATNPAWIAKEDDNMCVIEDPAAALAFVVRAVLNKERKTIALFTSEPEKAIAVMTALNISHDNMMVSYCASDFDHPPKGKMCSMEEYHASCRGAESISYLTPPLTPEQELKKICERRGIDLAIATPQSGTHHLFAAVIDLGTKYIQATSRHSRQRAREYAIFQALAYLEAN